MPPAATKHQQPEAAAAAPLDYGRDGTQARTWQSLARVIRPHQWSKNVLLFVPLAMAHGLSNASRWPGLLAAFAAFCAVASSIYVVNDLLDANDDRHHPTKRRRPFASGALPRRHGPPIVAALLLFAAALCFLPPVTFALWLVFYLALSTAYSLYLKRKLLIDVMVLAGLYTLRLLAGGAAAGVPVSRWMLAFSVFLFVSLAFAKRYTELLGVQTADPAAGSLRGRAYHVEDLRIIESAGPASGYLAVMVLALYISDSTGAASNVARYYPTPDLLWLLCPLLMYWITRVWFVARRGALHDDPILFAVKDRVSWMALGVAAILVVAASRSWAIG